MDDELRTRICARYAFLLKAECFFEKLIDQRRNGRVQKGMVEKKGDCDNQQLESE